MEGAWFHQLGCYLIVDRSEDKSKVKKIFFAKDQPSESSDLARCIIRYIRGYASKPVAELDFSGLTDFQKNVYAIVSRIPRSKTITYGHVAILLGKPGASRAVGRAMSTNPFAIVIPCHRVVSSKGFGGYRWGNEIKEKLLALEQEESL
jgi:methylated-DNA-[protein]-cysteine S-methyltransferase